MSQLIEWRVPEATPGFDLKTVHLLVVLVGTGAYGVMFGVIGLNEHAAGRIAPAGATGPPGIAG